MQKADIRVYPNEKSLDSGYSHYIDNAAGNLYERRVMRRETTEKGLQSMKIQGPIEVNIEISITDGKRAGVATIGLGKGRYPTEAEMREAVAEFERESMPDGFRLMTKREWWDTVLPPTYEEDEDGSRHATHFAVPGGDDYDA